MFRKNHFAFLGLLFIAGGADWTSFRGGANFNAASEKVAPISLDEKSTPIWKVALPGKGHSSPIVIGERAFVTCSSGPKEQRLHVVCIDTKTGTQLWERQFWATGRTICHPTSTVAAPTPASDGKRIFAFYSSNDLVCLDLDGNLLWYRGLSQDFPAAFNDVGMASSPLVVSGSVFVQVENQGDSFAIAIDAATGETRWRRDRPRTMAWASPALFHGTAGSNDKDRDLVLLQSPSGLSAHDPQTGEPQFEFTAKSGDISSAAVANGVVYLPSDGITALQPDGQSLVAKVLWKATKLNPGAASPVVQDGKIYIVNRAGVLNCADTAKGDVLWQVRLKGPFWATPLISGDSVYLFNEEGLAQVVKLGEKGEAAGTLALEEKVLASPAISGGALYIRSEKHLWKFGNAK